MCKTFIHNSKFIPEILLDITKDEVPSIKVNLVNHESLYQKLISMTISQLLLHNLTEAIDEPLTSIFITEYTKNSSRTPKSVKTIKSAFFWSFDSTYVQEKCTRQ